MKSKKLLGFTLIELLIVIAIIGILAVAFLPSLLDAPAKSRDAQRLATVQKIQNFLVSYGLEGKTLPVSGCIKSATTEIGKLIDLKVSDFGGVFPKDPDPANVTKGADTINCTGEYGYIKYTNVGSLYTAGVVVHVERDENANILCESVKGAVDPTVDPNLVIAPANAGKGCYLVLIQ